MKYLITGVAGFIGYHTAKRILESNNEIIGIDNINDFYDVNLKNKRIEILSNYNNFYFKKIDIINRKDLNDIFLEFKPKKVVNLAAQAGVRYSLENPYSYMDSNLVGFLNIIELCRNNSVEGLVYASSSSVYGGNSKIPFSVEDRTDNPISLYAASKKSNELIANSYSSLYDLNT